MSYLHATRLHFAGRFRADVSTVNNVRQHFDDDNFNPDLQKPLSGGTDRSNWQPDGTGAWRLLDCRVTSGSRTDGPLASTPVDDMAIGLSVRESGDRSAAKIVDLDPDQQGVSMLFGLTICLIDSHGHVLMQGEFEPAAFYDLRAQRSTGGGDAGRSAYFQSVLTNVTWGDIAKSPCLTQLKQLSAAEQLSIRFITDGYRTGGPMRGYGRIVGTIGPHFANEPHTFIGGRHLQVQTDGPPNPPEFSQSDCVVDAARRKILIDVGNLLKVDSKGDFADMGDISLEVGTGAAAASLGTLSYKAPGTYSATAGIFELPQDRPFTDAELATVLQNPLRMTVRPSGALTASVFGAERDDGIYLRAEQFVFRVAPGEIKHTDLIATRFGAPFANATPRAAAFPFSPEDNLPLPDIAVNPKTDAEGRARLTITGVDPGNPRKFIDGLVYGVVCSLDESQTDLDVVINAERNFISILNFDPFPEVESPGWDDVRKIFKKYGDLYPRPHGPNPYAPFDGLPPSRPVVNLADRDSVIKFAPRILWALELPIEHPSHMPVTRDLSLGKRKRMIAWLRSLGVKGTPIPPIAITAAATKTGKPVTRSTTKSPVVDIRLLRHRS
ncbi:hypothetical protein NKI39_15705 [Mesorhizobium sp. M0664]|uniref:hypothetical protein n=1 Tax=Mesorhizobium sp. M0664 TaxID=2956982 RepID=UPI00333BCD0C